MEPQGRWPRHIHAVRRERGWSQTRGFKEARESLGLGPESRSAYIAIERKGPRNEAEEQALAAVYGWPPTEAEPVTAQPDLAAAVTLLVEELQAMRRERETTEARLRALEAELKQLRERPIGGGSPVQSVLGQ